MLVEGGGGGGAVGMGVGTGVGLGVGFGVAIGVVVGFGVAVGLGVGFGVPLGFGVAVGLAVAPGADGVARGCPRGVGVGLAAGVALAPPPAPGPDVRPGGVGRTGPPDEIGVVVGNGVGVVPSAEDPGSANAAASSRGREGPWRALGARYWPSTMVGSRASMRNIFSQPTQVRCTADEAVRRP